LNEEKRSNDGRHISDFWRCDMELWYRTWVFSRDCGMKGKWAGVELLRCYGLGLISGGPWTEAEIYSIARRTLAMGSGSGLVGLRKFSKSTLIKHGVSMALILTSVLHNRDFIRSHIGGSHTWSWSGLLDVPNISLVSLVLGLGD
jgi:hypothetical protein